MEKIIIGLASDHAGYSVKDFLHGYLEGNNYQVIDYGCMSEESCDYPDFAHKLAEGISNGECYLGIAVCGSGNGISMALNKHANIRAALCWNEEIAKLARLHNNANVCSIPGRFVDNLQAANIADVFLHTAFEGGRHANRVDKIALK